MTTKNQDKIKEANDAYRDALKKSLEFHGITTDNLEEYTEKLKKEKEMAFEAILNACGVRFQELTEEEILGQFTTLKQMYIDNHDPEEHVYCSDCRYFSATEDDLHCPYSEVCYFWNPEDSAPRKDRWHYVPREEERENKK